MVKKTDEENKDNWFNAQLFKHYLLLLGLICALVVWGFSVNTTNALQDERIVTMQKSIEEIKAQGKETLNKVNEIDKKLPDARTSELESYRMSKGE